MRLALTSLLLLWPATLLADPSYHRVTGVTPDDTLNVRAEPSADSADIGDLAHDATGIELIGTDPTGKWGRIVWGDGNGWIATRFLAPDPVPMLEPAGVPVGLFCSGTEPFWSTTFSGAHVQYSDLGDNEHSMQLTGIAVAEGYAATPALISFANPSVAGEAILSPAICSDDMSDRDYPWRIDLVIEDGGGRRFLTGCCRLPLN